MSDAEQDIAIARLVKDRTAVRRQMALLESELQAAGRAFFEIGGQLRNVKGVGSFNETPGAILSSVEKAPTICDLGRIKIMLEELRASEKTMAQLNHTASLLGID
jgi:hypothetical protein